MYIDFVRPMNPKNLLDLPDLRFYIINTSFYKPVQKHLTNYFIITLLRKKSLRRPACLCLKKNSGGGVPFPAKLWEKGRKGKLWDVTTKNKHVLF